MDHSGGDGGNDKTHVKTIVGQPHFIKGKYLVSMLKQLGPRISRVGICTSVGALGSGCGAGTLSSSSVCERENMWHLTSTSRRW